MRTLFLSLLFLSALIPAAEARYIDYPGGSTVMWMNDGETNSMHYHYTVTPYASVGYNLDYWREEEWTMHTAALAWLLKRWNLPDAQASLYFRGGAGAAVSDFREFDDKSEFGGHAGFAFDAEDRRYYFAYEGHYVEAGEIFGAFEHKARIGFAPYVAEYGSLHTWILLQVDHRPESEDSLVWTPMLRFFKGDWFVDVGVSDSEEVVFNLMVRF